MPKHKSDAVKMIKVIEVKTVIGNGERENPFRCITEYWSLNGRLLAVDDPSGWENSECLK